MDEQDLWIFGYGSLIANTHVIARQIVRSIGPSGDNVEYVLRLEESLSELEAHDDHVMEIATRVRQLL